MITAQEAIERLERAQSRVNSVKCPNATNIYDEIAELIRHQQEQIDECNLKCQKAKSELHTEGLDHNIALNRCHNEINDMRRQLAANTKLRSDLLADDRNQDPPGMEQKI